VSIRMSLPATPPPLASLLATSSPPPAPVVLEGLQELHNASQLAVAHISNHLEVHDADGHGVIGHPLRSPPMPGEDDIPRMNPFLAIILLYGVMLLMVGAQTGLFLWKKRHRKSYELVTLIGLWLMPALFSFHLKFWRFLLVWTVYSAVTGRLLYLCTQKKLARTTPRQVYSFFLGMFRVSKVIGVVGYVLVLLEIFGLGPVMRYVLPKDLALDLVWYGVYFGIMGRDCAQVASDGLAVQLGNEGRQLVSRVNNW
jgi:RING finger protein 121